jgi:hypothetical protein
MPENGELESRLRTSLGQTTRTHSTDVSRPISIQSVDIGTDTADATVLDKTHVRYSYKHTNMVTLTVAGTVDPSEWHLPTYDPQNTNKYHYKLHSLDIYFWTKQDALSFVNGVRRVLPASQIEILDEPAPPAPQQPEVSAVVKKLEHAAISDPAYNTPKPAAQGAPSFAPPPMSAVAAETSNFVPMAYNPAAPAAPEAVRHREKTPPPEDGGINPLHAVVAYDAQSPFSPGFVPPPSFSQAAVASPGLPPPQFGVHPGLHRASTMPVHGGLASPGLTSPYAGYPGSPGFAAPPPPPPPPTQAPTAHPTPPVTSPGLPPPPPGGYSQYSYSSSTPAAAAHGGNNYAIHQQAYRPTEGETAIKYQPKTEPRGRLEENAGRLERGVTGMFKKFEKKFG